MSTSKRKDATDDIQDAQEVEDTRGTKAADKLAQVYGSWPFVIGQAILFPMWMAYNSLVFFEAIRFDPFPFILLNLTMSAQAAFSTPIILMANNRSAAIAQQRNETLLKHLQDILKSQDKTLAWQDDTLKQQDETLQRQDEILDQQNVKLKAIEERLCAKEDTNGPDSR